MKSASTALINLINAARTAIDSPIAFADCYTFALATGTVIAVTNVDYPVTYNGVTYSCTGVLLQGMKYTAKVGLEVDKQQITIAARPTDLVSGNPWLNALREGAFDGATFTRTRVFLTEP